MTEKPPVLNARLQWAIEQGFPLRWSSEFQGYRVCLYAITRTDDTGREHTSLLETCGNFNHALKLDAHLRKIGHTPANSTVIDVLDKRGRHE